MSRPNSGSRSSTRLGDYRPVKFFEWVFNVSSVVAIVGYALATLLFCGASAYCIGGLLLH